MTRLLPSIPGYMYAQKDDAVYVNLFAASTAALNVKNKPITIVQENNYPFDGNLSFTVSGKSIPGFKMFIRIPGWAQNSVLPSDLYNFVNGLNNKITIKLNGAELQYEMQKGYAVIDRAWKSGDKVEVVLPMETRLVRANEKLKEDEGKLAVERGPLVYCAEWVDNGGKVSNIVLPATTVFEAHRRNEMLNGVTVLTTKAPAINIGNDGQTVSTSNKTLVLIPYYAWANRGKGEMTVWFPERVKDLDLIPVEHKIEDKKSN